MLKNIDLLGPPINLKITKNSQFKTTIGAFFTITILLLSVGAFFGLGIDLFERKAPRGAFNKLYNSTQEFIITEDNFLFSIYDQYTNIPYEELDRKFQINMQVLDSDGEGNENVYEYQMVKCTNKTIDKWMGNLGSVDPGAYFCLEPGQKLKVFGIINTGKNAALRLQVNYCENKTSSDNCYSRDFIEKNITERIQMNYLIENTKVDTLNFTFPATPIQVSGLVNTNTHSWSRLNIFFKNIKFITDQGWLFPELREEVYQAVDEIYSEIVYTPETNTIFSHLMGNSPFTDTYTRNYVKVQEIFAMMGGFINAALLIARAIVTYLTKPEIVDIFNKRFKYHEVSKEDFRKLTVHTTPSSEDSEEDGKTWKKIIATCKNKKEISKISSEQESKYVFGLNFCEKMFRACNMSKRNKIFNKVHDKILKTISYENLTLMSLKVKIIEYLVLENYHRSLIRLCTGNQPEKNMELDEAYKMLEADTKEENIIINKKLILWLNNT
jgi:hypothetical protein